MSIESVIKETTETEEAKLGPQVEKVEVNGEQIPLDGSSAPVVVNGRGRKISVEIKHFKVPWFGGGVGGGG